jgi:hypothetical protein
MPTAKPKHRQWWASAQGANPGATLKVETVGGKPAYNEIRGGHFMRLTWYQSSGSVATRLMLRRPAG